MAARFISEPKEAVQQSFGGSAETTTSDLIEHFLRMGFEYVDVLRMLGIAVRAHPRQHIDLADWLQHNQVDHAEDHDNLSHDFEG